MGYKKRQLQTVSEWSYDESFGMTNPITVNEHKDDWSHHTEGQLAVDVAETEEHIIVVSTLAGAKVEDIEVAVHNDLLTIRGSRLSPVYEKEVHYFHEECFWGKFSRTVVLPQEVKGELARAEYKNGVLTIRIPKRSRDRKIPIKIVEE